MRRGDYRSYGYGEAQPRGQVVSTYRGIDVYFNAETKKFEAKLGRSVIERKDLSAIEKEIAKRTSGPATLMTQGGDPVTVVAREPNGRWRLDNGELMGSYTPLYQHDEQLAAEIKAEKARWATAESEHREIMHQLHQRLVMVNEMPETPLQIDPDKVAVGKRRGA